MKFKPGLTINFIPRYVQISKRALRYFKNESESYTGKPIVSIRKTIIKSAQSYLVNKGSYLKPGSAVTKSHKEDKLFDNMFEIVLNQDYEDSLDFKKFEHDNKIRREREQYEREEQYKKLMRSSLTGRLSSTRNTTFTSKTRPSPSKLNTSIGSNNLFSGRRQRPGRNTINIY